MSSPELAKITSKYFKKILASCGLDYEGITKEFYSGRSITGLFLLECVQKATREIEFGPDDEKKIGQDWFVAEERIPSATTNLTLPYLSLNPRKSLVEAILKAGYKRRAKETWVYTKLGCRTIFMLKFPPNLAEIIQTNLPQISFSQGGISIVGVYSPIIRFRSIPDRAWRDRNEEYANFARLLTHGFSISWPSFVGASIGALGEEKTGPETPPQLELDRRIRESRDRVIDSFFQFRSEIQSHTAVRIDIYYGNMVFKNMQGLLPAGINSNLVQFPNGLTIREGTEILAGPFLARILEPPFLFPLPAQWNYRPRNEILPLQEEAGIKAGTCFDFIAFDDENIGKYLAENIYENIVLQSEDRKQSVCYTRTDVAKQIESAEANLFPCADTDTAVRYDKRPNVRFIRLNLKSPFYVPLFDLAEMIQDPSTQLFRLFKSSLTVKRSTSATLSHPCRPYTGKEIYRVEAVRFEEKNEGGEERFANQDLDEMARVLQQYRRSRALNQNNTISEILRNRLESAGPRPEPEFGPVRADPGNDRPRARAPNPY